MPNSVTTTKQRKDQLLRRAMRKFVKQPGDAWLLCRMAWWVSVLSIAARFCSLPRALALVAGRGSRTRRADGASAEQLARSIDLLFSVDLFWLKPICWKRAAVLHRYLLREGITTRIIFGVRNETDGKVAGHAWLEADGVVILESSPPDYVVTYRFPSDERTAPQLAALSLE